MHPFSKLKSILYFFQIIYRLIYQYVDIDILLYIRYITKRDTLYSKYNFYIQMLNMKVVRGDILIFVTFIFSQKIEVLGPV